ncbi:hypothetical protein TI03_03230, partial [Achromatium sp. WMS1]
MKEYWKEVLIATFVTVVGAVVTWMLQSAQEDKSPTIVVQIPQSQKSTTATPISNPNPTTIPNKVLTSEDLTTQKQAEQDRLTKLKQQQELEQQRADLAKLKQELEAEAEKLRKLKQQQELEQQRANLAKLKQEPEAEALRLRELKQQQEL